MHLAGRREPEGPNLGVLGLRVQGGAVMEPPLATAQPVRTVQHMPPTTRAGRGGART